MIARIRFPRGRRLRHRSGKNRRAALAFSALLTPVALMAYVLGLWRLAADIGMAGEFGITGTFSHWQVWIALAVAVHVAGRMLARYGSGESAKIPQLPASEQPDSPAPAAARERRRA